MRHQMSVNYVKVFFNDIIASKNCLHICKNWVYFHNFPFQINELKSSKVKKNQLFIWVFLKKISWTQDGVVVRSHFICFAIFELELTSNTKRTCCINAHGNANKEEWWKSGFAHRLNDKPTKRVLNVKENSFIHFARYIKNII